MHFPLIIYIIIQALKTRRTEVRLYASNSLTCAEILINVRSRTLTLTTDERLDGSIFVFEYGAGSVAGWYGAGEVEYKARQGTFRIKTAITSARFKHNRSSSSITLNEPNKGFWSFLACRVLAGGQAEHSAFFRLAIIE